MRVERGENYGALLCAMIVEGASEVRLRLSGDQLAALHDDLGRLIEEIAEERDEGFFKHGGPDCWRCGGIEVIWSGGDTWCPDCGHEYCVTSRGGGEDE